MGRDHGWLKLYYSVLDDRKVMLLPAADRWFWIELLCIAGEHDQEGYLPDLESISFRLDRSLSVTDRVRIGVELLIDRNLIDKEKGGASGYRLHVHDWEDWQPKSKTSTDRVRKFRALKETGEETRSSRAPAKTRLDYRQTDRQTAGMRPREEPISILSQSPKQQKIPLRPIEDEDEPTPALQARSNGADPDDGQAEFLLDRLIVNYETSIEKTVPRAKVQALWEMLSPSEQRATVEGFLVWLLETKPIGAEPVDPKFIKGLDKLLEEGSLKRRKIIPPGIDRHGKPLADVRPAILASWLGGELYRNLI